MNKREFIKNSALLLAGSGFYTNLFSSTHQNLVTTIKNKSTDFWSRIRDQYALPNDFINLENGYYCITPQPILNAYFKHIRKVNTLGAFYMRTVQFENKKKIAAKLAEVFGCNTNELIITRNTTESLDTIISGLNWQMGDEAIMAHQDYGSMLDMFKQIAARYGTKNSILNIPIDPVDDEEIVKLYENAITNKTKLIMVCHMINITGQILPIKKICDMAHKKGVKVLVDGAHAIAHINFKINDLNCDYYGASLHKWLSNPLGAGILYVKHENSKDVWPLFADSNFAETDINKLNHTGTIPVYTDLVIEDALNYYLEIGAQKKEDRLRYLQNYWVSQVQHEDGIYLNTPKDKQRSCAIANVGVKGISPADLAKTLLNKYKIFTVAIDTPYVKGVRITPNLYTTTLELDKLVVALKEINTNKK